MKHTLKAIAFVILIVTLVGSCTRNSNETYYYNAYSPLYDEFFILKSDKPLTVKDVVWFDDNAAATQYATPYVATIISPYNK